MAYTLKVRDLGGDIIVTLIRAKVAELRAAFDKITKDGAADARSTHRYVNRTGNLEGSTVGGLEAGNGRNSLGQFTRGASRDDPAAYMEEGMHYASYVRSLSGFDKAVARARVELDRQLAQWCDEMSVLVGFSVRVNRQDF